MLPDFSMDFSHKLSALFRIRKQLSWYSCSFHFFPFLNALFKTDKASLVLKSIVMGFWLGHAELCTGALAATVWRQYLLQAEWLLTKRISD